MHAMIHVGLNKTKAGGIALAAAAALALAGCGGGGGAAGEASPATTLSGTAAVGAPISGATVNVVCATGAALTGIANTSTTGAWSVNVSGQTLPCAVQITGGTINGSANATAYQSIATLIGTVNVTPLTSLLIANLAGTTTPSTWFTGLTGVQLNAITAARVTTALGNLRIALGLTALNGINPVTLAFNPTGGVVMDDILTALASAIISNGSSYASLLNLAGASAGAGFTTAGVNTALTTAYANTSSGGSGGGGFITSCIANNYSHGVTAAQLTPFVRSYSGNLYASNAPGTPAGAVVNLAIAVSGGITYNSVLQPVTSICQDNTNPAQIYVQFLSGHTLSGLDFFTDGGVTGNLADANLTMVQGGSCSTAGGCGTGTTGGTPTVAGLMGGAIQGTPLNLTNTVTTSQWMTYLGEMTTDGTNFYVADRTFFRVTKFNPTTGAQTTLAGAFTITAGFVDGVGAAAKFGALGGITTDGTNLYVSDIGNHSIRKIVIATGVVTTLAGSGVAGGADGTGASAQFNQPHGITTDNTNLYVADYVNNRIRKIVIATGVVTTLAGSGVPSRVDGTGSAATFSNPYVITTDGTNLYESDLFGGIIRKIVIATGVVTTMPSGGTGLAFTSDVRGLTSNGTNLYLTDNNGGNVVVRKIVIATGVMSLLAGGGTAVTPTVDGVGTAAKFSAVGGAITTDGTSLYVADGQDFRRIQ